MTTELRIVNAMLRANGQRSTPTLSTNHPDVVNAKEALTDINKDFQGKGWWFNRNLLFSLVPQTDGVIEPPADTLSIMVTANTVGFNCSAEKARYIMKEGKMYDTYKHTFTIGKTLIVDMINLVPIDGLPEMASTYLRHKATLEYYEDDDGDLGKADRLRTRVQESWNIVKAEELRNLAVNALDSPSAMGLTYRIGQSGSPSNPMYPGGRRY